MTEQPQYKKIEKQMHAAGVPFQIMKSEPKDVWITNYAYYLNQKTKGLPLRPLIGRYQESQFQVYDNGEWVNKDMWKDYSYTETVDGKERKRLFFDHKYEYLLKFENKVSVEYWNKDTKQREAESTDTAWVRVSKSVHTKLQEELEDPRNKPDSFFMLKYTPNVAPADQYKIVFIK